MRSFAITFAAAVAVAVATPAPAAAVPLKQPAAEDFDPQNCPFNSKIPSTCWGDSAYQHCPADRQGAYNAVMAQKPDQQAMHAVFVGLTSGKIPGCKVATPDEEATATEAPKEVTKPAATCKDAMPKFCQKRFATATAKKINRICNRKTFQRKCQASCSQIVQC